MSTYLRRLEMSLPAGQTAFLWGPRKVGKSTLLAEVFASSKHFNLLDTRTLVRFTREPWLFAQEVMALSLAQRQLPIIVDEVQRVPALLDEVHRLIEQEGLVFLLCGSSARKLKRGAGNLLGGRAWRFQLHPLTTREIPEFDLLRALNRGLVPSHYNSSNYSRSLNGYVLDYLKEEVFNEGLTRNIAAFSRFFDALGFSHGEILNFSSLGRDCGVDSKTVREYFQILEDTLLGYMIEPFARRRSRAILTRAPKFYLFDVGVAGFLSGRRITATEGPEFGRAFEHFVLMELIAARSYLERNWPIRYWRTKTGLEVDFVLGAAGEIAIEVKGGRIRLPDLKGIQAYVEEHRPNHAVVVSNEDEPRRVGEIDILPWRVFLERLWTGEVGA
ncbi:MAG: AAA family ATPase [Gammaproteobacteria bacterium]|nr:AAA family ATPase [Gammaproteobacteria bacterium]